MQKEERGYLLTGDPAFVDAYKRASSDFYTFHGYLTVLVVSKPSEADQLTRIRQRLESWISQSATPDIAAKRGGQDFADAARAERSESLMNVVRRSMEQFEKEQMDIYQVRSAAAARARILSTFGVDLVCVIAAGLMIASSSYSFLLYRRQLKKQESADARIRPVIDHILDGMITIDEKGAVSSMKSGGETNVWLCRERKFRGRIHPTGAEMFRRRD